MGTLFLVATPIGNLEDMTQRAIRVLREVQLIAAEDTRHTRKLLTHFAIATPTTSYHEHSPQARRDALLQALAVGDVALVCDAGTPALSDPGADLVREALAAGHAVIPVPGATAAISALVASGLPTDQFTFLGFLPRRPTDRRAALQSVRNEPRTLILYEAPHRVLACLDDILAVLGDRQIAVARELTKLHEEWLRNTVSAVRAHYATGAAPRGEFTLVVAGAAAAESAATATDAAGVARAPEEIAREQVRALIAMGMGTREAAARVATTTGLTRREVYRLALNRDESDE